MKRREFLKLLGVVAAGPVAVRAVATAPAAAPAVVGVDPALSTISVGFWKKKRSVSHRVGFDLIENMLYPEHLAEHMRDLGYGVFWDDRRAQFEASPGTRIVVDPEMDELVFIRDEWVELALDEAPDPDAGHMLFHRRDAVSSEAPQLRFEESL